MKERVNAKNNNSVGLSTCKEYLLTKLEKNHLFQFFHSFITVLIVYHSTKIH